MTPQQTRRLDVNGTSFSIDPGICFGRVRFSRSSVSIECVVDRFLAGEDPYEIALDYDSMSTADVHNAIRFWLTRRRKENRDFLRGPCGP